MKRLSELKDSSVLIIEDYPITKEDLLEDIECYRNKEVFTSVKHYAGINALDMLKSELEYESDDMYEGWFESILEDVKDEDVKEIQNVLDRIFSRNKQKNFCYEVDEKVEIDM